MKIMRAVSISCVVCLSGSGLAGTQSARADDCALVATDAWIAQAKLPHATTHVMSVPGKPPTRVEMIFSGDKVYVQMNGTWLSMAYSAQEQIDTLNAARKRTEKATPTCQKLGSEPINGEAAALLIMHSEANGKTSEARVWLSDKTGLLLKSEVHLDSGTVITDNFRYGNIEVPAGVK